jgi:hypothetical protein
MKTALETTRASSPSPRRALRGIAASFSALACVLAVGCSSGDDDSTPAVCTSTGGPVAGVEDTHCTDSAGDPIVQSIGECQTGPLGAGGSGDEEDPADEPYEVRYGSSAQDDDCKYNTSFSNSCIELNKPVTLTLSLKKRADGDAAATGAVPKFPEIFLADDPSHISPSSHIQAPEGPPGTYKIGPIVFDRSGRWVVRFHFFEECSDIPEDSPHGHVAYYVDVP